MTHVLNAHQTANHLPWGALVDEIALVLNDSSVKVPPRLVQALAGGGSLFVMPAHDACVAMTKLITFTPANVNTGRPTIQGDVVVFDIATGERRLVLDGPVVTARRTAAVSVLAARHLAPRTDGPLLIVGAGVQGTAHLEAFAEVMHVKDVVIASRGHASAQALALRARSMGLTARLVPDANTALSDCPLAVVCTPASGIALSALPRSDAFVSAVGAFTPHMFELGPELCQHFAQHGSIWLDTPDARHEAGDLLQAGLDLERMATLHDLVSQNLQKANGPVLFKSCGWAAWDLAAARVALQRQR